MSNPFPVALLAFASAFGSGSALAHITLETGQAVAGSFYKAVIKVPHGCDGSPTTRIRVQIPDGVSNVKPQLKHGWKLSVSKVRLERPVVDSHGNRVTEAVKEVSWGGGRLPDENYEEFVMQVRLPDAPGTTLYFPVVQECVRGVHRWIEIPEAGRKPSDYKQPAPSLRLLPKPTS